MPNMMSNVFSKNRLCQRATRWHPERKRRDNSKKNEAQLKKMEETNAGKVAQCPKCWDWFPTFEKRNEHRASCKPIKVKEMKKRLRSDDSKVAFEIHDELDGKVAVVG